MATAYEISMFLNDLLNVKAFSGDSSNNGLQFDAGNEVKKAVFGVDACKDLFDFAPAFPRLKAVYFFSIGVSFWSA